MMAFISGRCCRATSNRSRGEGGALAKGGVSSRFGAVCTRSGLLIQGNLWREVAVW
eukprot:COSAG03_NODE_5_length_26473_cov_42.749526_17_plen_56_part_00